MSEDTGMAPHEPMADEEISRRLEQVRQQFDRGLEPREVRLLETIFATLKECDEARDEIERLRQLLVPFVALARRHAQGPYTGLDDWPITIEIKTGILRDLIK